MTVREMENVLEKAGKLSRCACAKLRWPSKPICLYCLILKEGRNREEAESRYGGWIGKLYRDRTEPLNTGDASGGMGKKLSLGELQRLVMELSRWRGEMEGIISD